MQDKYVCVLTCLLAVCQSVCQPCPAIKQITIHYLPVQIHVTNDDICNELHDCCRTDSQTLCLTHFRLLTEWMHFFNMQVINETLRCSILAPWAARLSHDDLVVRGCKIPAKTPIIQPLGVILHDARLFEDPTSFDPERFSKENRKKVFQLSAGKQS